METFEKIYDLSDCRGFRFYRDEIESLVIVQFERWDTRIVFFRFHNPVFIYYSSSDSIRGLFKTLKPITQLDKFSNLDFSRFNYYRFLDISDEYAFEIVCEKLEVSSS